MHLLVYSNHDLIFSTWYTSIFISFLKTTMQIMEECNYGNRDKAYDKSISLIDKIMEIVP